MRGCLFIATVILGFLFSLEVSAENDLEGKLKHALKPNRLFLPTYIEKVGSMYFVVDSYNNRILYNDRIDNDIENWSVMDGRLSRPHSLASDGTFILVDDTEAQNVNVYRIQEDGYEKSQIIDDVGIRPHRTIYDPVSKAFFVLAANSQEITKLVARGDVIHKEYKKSLDFLEGAYTRSMKMINGRMYFVSGPSQIIAVEYLDDTYEVVGKWRVPGPYSSMNDLAKIGERWVLTATMNKMISCQTLDLLERNECVDIYSELELQGNPYYVNEIDGDYYIGEVGHANRILKIKADKNGKVMEFDYVM